MADFLKKVGTPLTFQSSGGSAALTATSLAVNAGRQSVKVDLGATFAPRYAVHVKAEFATAPAAGGRLEAWGNWSSSATAGTDNQGGCDGSDSAYKAGEADEWKVQLDPLGALVVTNDTDGVVQAGVIGVIEPKNRYLSVVLVNKASTALSATAADHVVTLIPLVDTSA